MPSYKSGDVSKHNAYEPLKPKDQRKLQVMKNVVLKTNKGFPSLFCDGVISVSTYKKWRRDDPEWAEEIDIIIDCHKQERLDKAEALLYDVVLDDAEITKNRTELLKFILKTQGKERGYTERQEIKTDGPDTEIKIQYIVPEQPKIQDIEDQATIEVDNPPESE